MLGKKVAQGVFPTTKALPEIPQEITACMSLLSLLYHSRETVFLNLLFLATIWNKQGGGEPERTFPNSSPSNTIVVGGSLSDGHVASTNTQQIDFYKNYIR